MLGVSWLAEDMLGSTTFVAGLGATAAGTLSISIAAGRVYQLAATDTNSVASGDLPADSTLILQQGAAAAQSVLLSTAGLSAGQSRWALIEAGFQQDDVIADDDPNSGLLNFYNVDDPTQPFQGPANNMLTLPTVRQGQCSIRVIYGSVATTGSEVPPAADSGFVSLYLIDLAFGQTVVTQPNVKTAGPLAGSNVPNTYAQAPFIAGLISAGQYCADVGAANAYVIGLIGGRKLGEPVRVKIAANNDNTGASTLQDGSGAVAFVNPDGSALVQGQLKSGGIYEAVFDGTAYQLTTASFGQPRIRASGAIDFYVNASTGSDSNSGLSSGAPWLTLQKAWNTIVNTLDLNGRVVTVHCTGNFTTGLTAGGTVVGSSTAASVVFSFASGSSISATSASCFIAQNFASFTVLATGASLTLSATGTGSTQGYAFLALSGGFINMGANIVVGSCATSDIGASGSGSNVVFTAGFTTLGISGSLMQALFSGTIGPSGAFTITASASPNYTVATVVAQFGGVVNLATTTFSGAATGTRYNAYANGVINTAGGGANFIFGDVAGTVNLVGGVYGNGSGQYL